jgi:hypothetical protein
MTDAVDAAGAYARWLGVAGAYVALESARCLHCQRFHVKRHLAVWSSADDSVKLSVSGYCSECAPTIAHAVARDHGLGEFCWVHDGYGGTGSIDVAAQLVGTCDVPGCGKPTMLARKKCAGHEPASSHELGTTLTDAKR